MREQLIVISDIAAVAQSSAEMGEHTPEVYASVFETIATSLNFIIAALDERGGEAV